MAQGDSTGVGTRINIGPVMSRPDWENGPCAIDWDFMKSDQFPRLLDTVADEFSTLLLVFVGVLFFPVLFFPECGEDLWVS